MLLLQAYRSFAGNNDKPNLKIQILKKMEDWMIEWSLNELIRKEDQYKFH